MTWFMDQISEHQRDLSNSASSRFVVEFVAGLVAAAERTRSILDRLHVDETGIERNLRRGCDASSPSHCTSSSPPAASPTPTSSCGGSPSLPTRRGRIS
jgi:hypothetical protein